MNRQITISYAVDTNGISVITRSLLSKGTIEESLFTFDQEIDDAGSVYGKR
jgi:hypothetical protein